MGIIMGFYFAINDKIIIKSDNSNMDFIKKD